MRQPTRVRRRTHLLFDIAERFSNARMIRLAESLGATRCATYANHERTLGYVGACAVRGQRPPPGGGVSPPTAPLSPSFVPASSAGVDGADPTVCWTQARTGYASSNAHRSTIPAGPFAVDVQTRQQISRHHRAVLFADPDEMLHRPRAAAWAGPDGRAGRRSVGGHEAAGDATAALVPRTNLSYFAVARCDEARARLARRLREL